MDSLPHTMHSLLQMSTLTVPGAWCATLNSPACSGYVLHPVILEVGFSDCILCHLNKKQASLPVGFEVLRLPTSYNKLDTLVHTAGGSTMGTATSTVHEVHCIGVKSDWIDLPNRSANSPSLNILSKLVYEVEWKARDHQQAISVPSRTCLAPNWHSASLRRPSVLGSSGMGQAVTASTASMLEMLAAGKQSGVRNCQAQVRRCLLAERCIVPTSISTSSAAALAILNNLPYELPSITAHLCHNDPGRLGGDSLVSLGWQPSQYDMYGVAALGGVNFCPKLVYTYRGLAGPSGTTYGALAQESTRFSSMITGGLGGLGMLTAQWLSASTPCSLVLSSRSGLAPQGAHIRFGDGGNALVACAKCDVCFMEGAQATVSIGRFHDQNLCSTVHAAGAQVCL